jgi:hypothetical protein
VLHWWPVWANGLSFFTRGLFQWLVQRILGGLAVGFLFTWLLPVVFPASKPSIDHFTQSPGIFCRLDAKLSGHSRVGSCLPLVLLISVLVSRFKPSALIFDSVILIHVDWTRHSCLIDVLIDFRSGLSALSSCRQLLVYRVNRCIYWLQMKSIMCSV